MTNDELIKRIDEAAGMLELAQKRTPDAEVSMRAPWLRDLTPAQMIAIIDHYGGRVYGTVDEPWGTVSIGVITVFFYGVVERPDTMTMEARLRSRASEA